MNIGRLNRRISIHRRTISKDSWNHDVESWGEYARTWSDVKRKDGSESQIGEQRVTINKTEFIIRFRTDIQTTDLIEYESEFYDIESIVEIGFHEGLRIIATLRDSDKDDHIIRPK